MAFGLSAATVGLIGAGVGLAGGVMASNAAGDAADAQSAAAAASDATQRYQYDTTRADNAPFRETGVQANNRLAYLMGLGGGGAGAASAAPTIDDAWASLDSQHQAKYGSAAPRGDVQRQQAEAELAGLSAQWSAGQQSQQASQSDPAYGSLTRKFSTADMAADPVYNSGLQFGLSEGTKGINRQAAAGGSMLSGATLKALTRFGNDYGSTKANESYNRFNNDNTTQYNRLAGLSGAGQQSTNAVSAAGASMANNISSSQQGVGNARGSAYLSQGNAWQNAINGGVSAFKNSGTNSLGNWFVPSNADTTIPMQAGGGY